MASRIKILYRKNLKMTEGKLAAQSVHAVLGLNLETVQLTPDLSVVVLGVSDTKFGEAEAEQDPSYTVYDAGYTEVPAGTATCVAFLEEDPRNPFSNK